MVLLRMRMAVIHDFGSSVDKKEMPFYKNHTFCFFFGIGDRKNLIFKINDIACNWIYEYLASRF